jgi:uncharacterized protein (DUF362 family)
VVIIQPEESGVRAAAKRAIALDRYRQRTIQFQFRVCPIIRGSEDQTVGSAAREVPLARLLDGQYRVLRHFPSQ